MHFLKAIQSDPPGYNHGSTLDYAKRESLVKFLSKSGIKAIVTFHYWKKIHFKWNQVKYSNYFYFRVTFRESRISNFDFFIILLVYMPWKVNMQTLGCKGHTYTRTHIRGGFERSQGSKKWPANIVVRNVNFGGNLQKHKSIKHHKPTNINIYTSYLKNIDSMPNFESFYSKITQTNFFYLYILLNEYFPKHGSKPNTFSRYRNRLPFSACTRVHFETSK